MIKLIIPAESSFPADYSILRVSAIRERKHAAGSPPRHLDHAQEPEDDDYENDRSATNTSAAHSEPPELNVALAVASLLNDYPRRT